MNVIQDAVEQRKPQTELAAVLKVGRGRSGYMYW